MESIIPISDNKGKMNRKKGWVNLSSYSHSYLVTKLKLELSSKDLIPNFRFFPL